MTRPLSYSSVSLPSWTVTTFQTIVVLVRGRLGFTPHWSASGTSGEESDFNKKSTKYKRCTGVNMIITVHVQENIQKCDKICKKKIKIYHRALQFERGVMYLN